MPWRAPGTAPVYGSGCGVAGGSNVERDNGGIPPPGMKQGEDFLKIPPQTPTVWKRGSTQEVAWALFANHGGGYAWRLCKKGGNITEECFASNTLSLVGDTSRIRFAPIQQYENTRQVADVVIPAVRVTKGTYPAGSQWTRNPIPACDFCDQAECMRNNSDWEKQQYCSQSCSGLNFTGTEQFPHLPRDCLATTLQIVRCQSPSLPSLRL